MDDCILEGKWRKYYAFSVKLDCGVVSHISMDGVSIQWSVTPHTYDCLFGLSKSHRYRM